MDIYLKTFHDTHQTPMNIYFVFIYNIHSWFLQGDITLRVYIKDFKKKYLKLFHRSNSLEKQNGVVL